MIDEREKWVGEEKKNIRGMREKIIMDVMREKEE